jgi:hypothetical protein
MVYKLFFRFAVLIEYFIVLWFFDFDDFDLLVQKLLVINLFGRREEVNYVWFTMDFIAYTWRKFLAAFK